MEPKVLNDTISLVTTYLFQSLYVICSNLIFIVNLPYVTEFILYNSVTKADQCSVYSLPYFICLQLFYMMSVFESFPYIIQLVFLERNCKKLRPLYYPFNCFFEFLPPSHSRKRERNCSQIVYFSSNVV